jgi:hypothetical protein
MFPDAVCVGNTKRGNVQANVCCREARHGISSNARGRPQHIGAPVLLTLTGSSRIAIDRFRGAQVDIQLAALDPELPFVSVSFRVSNLARCHQALK